MIPSCVCVQKCLGLELIPAKCARKVWFKEFIFAPSYVVQGPVFYLFTKFCTLSFKQIFVCLPTNITIVSYHLGFLFFLDFLTFIFSFLASISVWFVPTKLGHLPTMNTVSTEGPTLVTKPTWAASTAIFSFEFCLV